MSPFRAQWDGGCQHLIQCVGREKGKQADKAGGTLQVIFIHPSLWTLTIDFTAHWASFNSVLIKCLCEPNWNRNFCHIYKSSGNADFLCTLMHLLMNTRKNTTNFQAHAWPSWFEFCDAHKSPKKESTNKNFTEVKVEVTLTHVYANENTFKNSKIWSWNTEVIYMWIMWGEKKI